MCKIFQGYYAHVQTVCAKPLLGGGGGGGKVLGTRLMYYSCFPRLFTHEAKGASEMRLGQLLRSIKFCLSIQKFCPLQTLGNARGWVNLQDCFFWPHLFLGVQSLFLKTEALDLIEVEAGLKGDHIVRRYSCHWPVSWVPSCVERQGCFPWNHLAGEGEGNMHQM